MTKRLIKSMQEALEYSQGKHSEGKVSHHHNIKPVEIPGDINLKFLRMQLHMTQDEFAARYGFNLYTLRNWECGRRHPDKAVLAYLYAISKDPKAIEKALRL